MRPFVSALNRMPSGIPRIGTGEVNGPAANRQAAGPANEGTEGMKPQTGATLVLLRVRREDGLTPDQARRLAGTYLAGCSGRRVLPAEGHEIETVRTTVKGKTFAEVRPEPTYAGLECAGRTDGSVRQMSPALALRQGSPEWIEGRRDLITGIDIPVLLGTPPVEVRGRPGHEKSGLATTESTLRMRIWHGARGPYRRRVRGADRAQGAPLPPDGPPPRSRLGRRVARWAGDRRPAHRGVQAHRARAPGSRTASRRTWLPRSSGRWAAPAHPSRTSPS